MNDATLITDGIGTRPAVRLERRLPDPPTVVWRAITEREQLHRVVPDRRGPGGRPMGERRLYYLPVPTRGHRHDDRGPSARRRRAEPAGFQLGRRDSSGSNCLPIMAGRYWC